MAEPDEIQINSITWVPEGIVIAYMCRTDVRAKGHLMGQHSLSLHRDHPDYREDMDKLHDRALAALLNALEDFEESEPWEGDDEVSEDDEEKGMGW
jgi:hypothetical protein